MPDDLKLFTFSWSGYNRLPDHLKEQVQPVRISVGRPRFIKGAGDIPVISMLTPGELFRAGLERKEFRKAYKKRLTEFGLGPVTKELEKTQKEADGKPLLLLCFEADPKDCHRSDFASWWKKETGEDIPEFETGELPLQ
jgi:hypothetical protein